VVMLYPGHIEKEDRRFFFPIMDYFNHEEQDAMLREFYEFDRGMIHEKYRVLVEGLEGTQT
jgi:hemerythrin-like domain-containing protein